MVEFTNSHSPQTPSAGVNPVTVARVTSSPLNAPLFEAFKEKSLGPQIDAIPVYNLNFATAFSVPLPKSTSNHSDEPGAVIQNEPGSLSKARFGGKLGSLQDEAS